MAGSSAWSRFACVAALTGVLVPGAFGWGLYGHRMANRLAGMSLPDDAPQFLRSAEGLDELAFYAVVPDVEWRSAETPELNALESPDHFIFLEYADPTGRSLPRQRYEFMRLLDAAQAGHPGTTMAPEKIGMLPYAVEEGYERLETAMRGYRRALGAKQNTRAAEEEILYTAGILGHFVADGSNPMHASIEYAGWVGANPHGYTTDKKVHGKFESDFVEASVKAADVAASIGVKPVVIVDVFGEYVEFLRHSNSLVEKTYALEKAGAFTGAGTAEGKAFVVERLAAGATELRDMIYTAWVRSGEPVPVQRGN